MHRTEPCPLPSSNSRRWRNALWVCPTCGQAWSLLRTNKPTPDGAGIYSEGRFWTWWKWPWGEDTTDD